MNHVLVIAKKELRAYFSSLIALIFVGTYLAVTVYVFFTKDAYFARNIADVRPLFASLPVMMIFLAAAITMRLWSEEQKLGTIEVLLTLPVKLHHLVLGKFLGAMGLVALALALTLGLPISVSLMGELDWGPVIGGYVGGLLLAGAYVSLGLLISSLTSNQVSALILSVVGGFILWIPGMHALSEVSGTGTRGRGLVELIKSMGAQDGLRSLSTGAHFDNIARGVIDVRDVAYYLSLITVFLVLNTLALRSKGFSQGPRTQKLRFNYRLFAALAGANVLLLNFWLAPVASARVDLTKHQIYSLSNVTKSLVRSIDNPLLIRGYISEKTHPLLAPLVPQIRDVIEEYAAASQGRVKAEFLDPKDDPELEKEANQQYSIKSFPFRIQSRNEAAVVNSYFSILVKYGDQYEVLGFDQLIEVNASGTDVDVRLRNLEYDLTRAIKKAVYGFQTLDSMFAELKDEVEFTAYITKETLPDNFKALPGEIETMLGELVTESGGKLKWSIVDPTAPGNENMKEELFKKFRFRPMTVSLFSEDSFYLHLLLRVGETYSQVMPNEGMSSKDLKNEIVAAVKRNTPGFLKTVGLVKPKIEDNPMAQIPGMPQQPPKMPPVTRMLEQQLGENYTLKDVDLSNGRVPGEVDTLLLFAPKDLDEKAAYAVDQYLMRGGSVIVLAGHYELDPMANPQGLAIARINTGLESVLASYGVTIDDRLVLDPQNESFPVPVERDLGGFKVREIQLVPYPFFVDVRKNGMAEDNPIVAGLPAVTVQWASPVTVSPVEVEGEKLVREVVSFLHSSEGAWTTTDTTVEPDFERHGKLGFPTGTEHKSYDLAVAVKGRFVSAFRGKANPLTGGPQEGVKDDGRTIPESPETARLVVVGSSSFANDLVLGISRQTGGDRFANNLQLVHNLVDWTLEDTDLLSIRAAGAFATTLNPMTSTKKDGFLAANYAVVLLAVAGLYLAGLRRRKGQRPMTLDPARSGTTPPATLGKEVHG